MQKNKVYLLILISILLLSTYSKITHECQHDKNAQQFQEFLIKSEETAQEAQARGRQLQTEQPIRLTFDTTSLNSLDPAYAHLKPFIEQQLVVAAEFFADKLLQIPYPYGNILFPSTSNTCIDYTVDSQDQTTGIANSDFHLYVNFANEPTSSWVANAGACVLKGATNKWRPVMGRVQYNIGYLSTLDTSRNLIFEDSLEVTLHEITHALGFSQSLYNYFINPATDKYYGYNGGSAPTTVSTVRGISSIYLSTPNVLAAAKEHYGCPTAQGMLLENQGGSGSAGSHWERTILQNEFMTASVIPTDAAYSVFTFALLEDSGWYTPTYTNLDSVSWGADRGCGFIDGACDYNLPEFSQSTTSECTFYNSGIGFAGSDTFSDNCSYVKVYSNRLCYDETDNYSNSVYFGDYFGEGSKCFQSNVMLNGYSSSNPVRCHKFECIGSQVNIIIEGEYFPCTSTQCVITITGNNTQYTGTVTPPADQDAFCNSYPQPCDSFCSGNGYCANNECHCNSGYAGNACDTVCPGEGVLENGICQASTTCSSGTLNPATKVCE